ncbi:MAG: hypothetical protein HY720_26585 [Planctomycetes bacterium]|nr:hypothetical protein [Planctomycetota bacterium]
MKSVEQVFEEVARELGFTITDVEPVEFPPERRKRTPAKKKAKSTARPKPGGSTRRKAGEPKATKKSRKAPPAAPAAKANRTRRGKPTRARAAR